MDIYSKVTQGVLEVKFIQHVPCTPTSDISSTPSCHCRHLRRWSTGIWPPRPLSDSGRHVHGTATSRCALQMATVVESDLFYYLCWLKNAVNRRARRIPKQIPFEVGTWMTQSNGYVFQGHVRNLGSLTSGTATIFGTFLSLFTSSATTSKNLTSNSLCVTLKDMLIGLHHPDTRSGWHLFWNPKLRTVVLMYRLLNRSFGRKY